MTSVAFKQLRHNIVNVYISMVKELTSRDT